jgi:adenosylhomocysteine nucleosidase
VIGIIGAMAEELEGFVEALSDAASTQRGGFTLYSGLLAGKPVLVAQCGIGKVNAAALAQLLILEGVTHVIFTGVAGALAPELDVGDIVVSSDAVQHDVDVRALGYALGVVPGEALSWPADEALRGLALAAAQALGEVRAVSGRVLSGDRFIADRGDVQRLRETFAGSCAEMEGAAVAQICSRAGVPFVIIRSISDRADGSAEADFRAFTPLAARRAKRVVLEMLSRL